MQKILLFFFILYQAPTLWGQIEKEVLIAEPIFTYEEWMQAFNQEGDRGKFYFSEGITVSPNGNANVGVKNIQEHHEYLKEQMGLLDTIDALYHTLADRDGQFTYEMGRAVAKDKRRYKFLWVSRKSQAKKRIELEFIAPASEDIPDVSEIDKARAQWMELCNAHNAYELVKACYTPNALYYNHKPLVIGTDAIAHVYAYMNKDSYSLTLTPLHVEPVSKTLVYEIGQCSGSYGGKYVIIWQKTEKGTWKVLLDSNI
ncbi:MAG: hypothetical protein AAGA10_12210 [Bacteroidota bacterium]